MRIGWLLPFLLPLLLLGSSCASLPKDDKIKRPVEIRQAELLAFENWQATGRIALNSPDNGVTASLVWEQTLNDYSVTLTAALGQGLKVSQQDNKATLTRRGKSPITGQSAEELVYEELRVRVPLRQLSFWLRGLPGTEGDPRYDTYGRLQQLKYLDKSGVEWRAKIERYNQVDGLDLPTLINVVGDVYTIRLILKEWEPIKSAPVDTPANNRVIIPGANS